MGENIGQGRWTAARKKAIYESRVNSTRQLVAGMPDGVHTFVTASAIGYYPSHPSLAYEESYRNTEGETFLEKVCRDWESAAGQAATGGRRVVPVRIGLVLGREGILARLIPIFRLGLGGPVSHGRQWVSWIHARDLVRLFLFVLETPPLDGPVNGVAPHPVPYKEFARTLGRVLHRPAIFPVPAFILRLAMGEAADLPLASLRVMPGQAAASGFQYAFPNLEDAVRDIWNNRRT
jgi:uncharacterized protein (TIGR01777 family)